MAIMGIVRLAPGRVGYFDDITRVHLTLSSPEKPVIEGMNTTNLKRAVKTGAIKLVSGSLDPETKVPVEQVDVAEDSFQNAPLQSEVSDQVSEVIQVGLQDQEEEIREVVIDDGSKEEQQEQADDASNDDIKTDAEEDGPAHEGQKEYVSPWSNDGKEESKVKKPKTRKKQK